MSASPSSHKPTLGRVSLVRVWVRHVVRIAWAQWLMVFAYLWVWFRRRIGLPHGREALSRIHRRHARRFKRAASHLKGANIKIGQLASLQAHILPPEYIEELKSLRDEVTPTRYRLVADLIERELGASPSELFAELDETPIASASMAQVHAARLHSGERVVVKVQNPSYAEAARAA